VDPIFIPFYLGNGKKYNRSVGITDRNSKEKKHIIPT
jgi:hypothetical protein